MGQEYLDVFILPYDDDVPCNQGASIKKSVRLLV